VGTYIALLRGINVGGRAKVSMNELRELFAELGYEDAKTYIQSGNVVFRAPLRSPARAASDIAARIGKDLGVRCSVLLRTDRDLAALLRGNPYAGSKADPSQLHVTFLDAAPGPKKAAELAVPHGESVEFTVAGREIYLRYPDGYGRTKFNNTYIEKRLGVVATTRNWNTVTKLHELALANPEA
jgi:uncharacterized protein (DUF1697 family)